MKKIIVEFSNERLITPSGLSLVGGALGKSDLVKRANRARVDSKRSQPQIKNGDILLTYIGLLCQGKPSFEAVRELHADPEYYKAALGISIRLASSRHLFPAVLSLLILMSLPVTIPRPARKVYQGLIKALMGMPLSWPILVTKAFW